MREQVINVVTLFGILGIPSIFAMFCYCIRAVMRLAKKIDILMDSQQAQMRADLIKDYKRFISDGWVEIDDLTDWEDRYQKYHCLGANGVMDSKRASILQLPNIPPN